jgi:hypothetical protein
MPKSEMMHELKMITSETVGFRAQIDLIDLNQFYNDAIVLKC